MINQIKLYLEQQNELILRDKKYLIRFFKINNGLYFTFVLHLSDTSEFSSIEFGMNKLNKGSIQFQNKSIKSIEFKTFKWLINKLNKLKIRGENKRFYSLLFHKMKEYPSRKSKPTNNDYSIN